MPGSEKAGFRRRILVIGVAALALLLAFGATSPAVAKKKKKKTPPAVTAVGAAPFSSAATGSATAGCTGKTHVSGGGWAVSPHFDPAGNTGLRSLNSTSTPLGTTGWTATSDSFTIPTAAGSITAFARCESNKLGQIATALSGSATVTQGQLADLVLSCPAGTHVISAGYTATGLVSHVNNPNNLRILILQSRRTSVNQWTITAFENSLVPATGNVSVTGLCERNAKGRSIGEVSTLSGFGQNQRASGDPSCPAKQHVVSGGYALSPTTSQIPVVGVDEFQPSGNRGWHLGLQAFNVSQPAGSSVATYAYCARDTVPAKKKKK